MIIKLIIISLILGIFVYIMSVFIRVYEKIKEYEYENTIKNIENILLRLVDDIIGCKTNPNQNVALLQILDKKDNSAKDKILILFSARPGVDTDGEVFITIGNFYQKEISQDSTLKKIIINSKPLFIADSRDNFEFYEYSRKNHKRIKNIYFLIKSYGKFTVDWAVEDSNEKCRKELLKFINKENDNGQ